MLIYYLKTAFRNTIKHKAYSSINVISLALGLTCCITIGLFVHQERSFDQFHEHYDSLYRLTLEVTRESGTVLAATSSPPMGPALQKEFPEVQNFVRFRDSNINYLISVNGNRLYEREVMYADPSFFEIFTFPLQQGNPATALTHPNSVVLSAAAAERYFGNSNPLGKTMTIQGSNVVVTGVLQPFPQTSHIRFDVLLPFEAFTVPAGYPVTLEDWTWTSFYTYVKLRDGTRPEDINPKLNAFIKQRMPGQRATTYRLFFQPMGEIYLSEPLINHASFAPSGNKTMLAGLMIVALVALGIACFNFMNLAMARAAQRAKEIGVRKLLGGTRAASVGQMLLESLLLAFLACLLSLLMLELSVELLRKTVGWNVSITASDYRVIIPASFILATIAGMAAGLYPAFVVGTVQPLHVFKQHLLAGFSIGKARSIIIVVQFASSVALLVSSLTVADQMKFIQTKQLGFEKENVVVLHLQGEELERSYNRLRQALIENPVVTAISRGGGMFDGTQGSVPFLPEGATEGTVYSAALYGVYPEFCKTLGIQLAEGREFSSEMMSDSSQGMMVNRAAVALFGWNQPIGKKLRWVQSQAGRIHTVREGTVIGVTEDFHFASLRVPVAPIVMMMPSAYVENVYVRIRGDNPRTAIASLEQNWKSVVHDFPFSVTFLDERLNQLYRSEEQFASLINVLTGIAILISLLGLVSLVAFAAERRSKEIGVRKVLGASVSSIVRLFAQDIVKLVLFANVVAWPMALFFVQRWLENFAYRVEIGLWTFVLAGGFVLMIALLTVGIYVVKAARSNPIEALRYE